MRDDDHTELENVMFDVDDFPETIFGVNCDAIVEELGLENRIHFQEFCEFLDSFSGRVQRRETVTGGKWENFIM